MFQKTLMFHMDTILSVKADMVFKFQLSKFRFQTIRLEVFKDMVIIKEVTKIKAQLTP